MPVQVEPAYKKTDFWDNLSRGETGGQRSREDVRAQREVDLETFGQMSISHYGRGRGGRGGRGGYRGGRGGRGGYRRTGGDGMPQPSQSQSQPRA